MRAEPRWARRLRFWLHDDSPEWVADYVAGPAMRAMCAAWGHEAIDDQCNRPEHRFCWRCNRAMPHAAVTP